MEENWLEIRIESENIEEYKMLLLSFVQPTVWILDENKLAETFHFFFEPYLLLRIRTQDRQTFDKVKSIIEENLKCIDCPITKIEIKENYTGEQEKYGEKGWEVAQKFFEYGSRISLLMNDSTFIKKSEFRDSKFVHCFLNTLGYNPYQEAVFHHERNIERWLMNGGYFDILERISSLEKEIQLMAKESKVT